MGIEHTACFSGYREEKFPFPLRDGNQPFDRLKRDLTAAILEAVDQGYGDFYTGACYGFDILAGEAVLAVRDKLSQPIHLLAAIPFENQAQLWSEHWRDRYYSMLERSDRVITLQPRYTRGCFQKRNQYMIDRSNLLICYHNGTGGGTDSTVRSAERQGRYVINLCKDKLVEVTAPIYTLHFCE
ncbi:MAG: DUF1273 domain-containing protein [Clostridiales bacterium]|jgi:uncharacterized phage-like protein YoqJ|nr:DUF1273 domain-containing protein [Clostridiales bacterium]